MCFVGLVSMKKQQKTCILIEPNTFITCTIAIYCMQYICHARYIWFISCVVVCTALWGKGLHRQVSMGIVVTLGKPTWCNGSTLARNARDVGTSPALGTVFPIFSTPTTHATYLLSPICYIHATYLLYPIYLLRALHLFRITYSVLCAVNVFRFFCLQYTYTWFFNTPW